MLLGCVLAYVSAMTQALAVPAGADVGAFPAPLFGYREAAQADIREFPLWVDALARQLRDNLRDGSCDERRLNRCHMRNWLRFLASVRGLPSAERLDRVNRYANDKNYVLDIDNFGVEDYWAIPREFFPGGGDCEDFAITKLLSLRWLGVDRNLMRIVVVQDTNLRVPHAVLAVVSGRDILILDNQVQKVQSHRAIVHYAPVYSINERAWWIHTPP